MASDSLSNQRLPINLRLRNWFTKKFQTGVHEEISHIIEDREESEAPLTFEERELIRAALKFRDVEADEIAIPRHEIVFLSAKDSFKKIQKVFVKTGHSRLPVCGEDLDDVIGFITLKDVVRFIGREDDFKLDEVVRSCPFVPDTLSINRVLQMMKAKKVQLAIVLDEYGGTSGLISLKDILEELVGDIDDENDEPESEMVRKLAAGQLQIDPRMEVEDFEEYLGYKLKLDEDDDGDYETIGGLILQLAGRVPTTSEKFSLPSGETFEILEADARRILKIKFISNGKKSKSA